MDPGLDMKNRIRVLRAEKGWSQAELADKVGVSRNSINAVFTLFSSSRTLPGQS